MKTKTHDLANSLRLLASILERGPNISLESLSFSSEKFEKSKVALSLSTLSDLSRIDKQQWLGFINDLGFPIDIRPRDASRDILGKLLNHLENSEMARERLKKAASSNESDASPELMKALSSLLKGQR
jgi:hypothetical protein